jgi:hypothetical protein
VIDIFFVIFGKRLPMTRLGFAAVACCSDGGVQYYCINGMNRVTYFILFGEDQEWHCG